MTATRADPEGSGIWGGKKSRTTELEKTALLFRDIGLGARKAGPH